MNPDKAARGRGGNPNVRKSAIWDRKKGWKRQFASLIRSILKNNNYLEACIFPTSFLSQKENNN